MHTINELQEENLKIGIEDLDKTPQLHTPPPNFFEDHFRNVSVQTEALSFLPPKVYTIISSEKSRLFNFGGETWTESKLSDVLSDDKDSESIT